MAQGRYLGQPVAVKVQGLCLDDQDDLDELSVEVCGGRHLGEGLSSQGVAVKVQGLCSVWRCVCVGRGDTWGEGLSCQGVAGTLRLLPGRAPAH